MSLESRSLGAFSCLGQAVKHAFDEVSLATLQHKGKNFIDG